MIRTVLAAGVAVACGAFGQPATQLSFEVASIKPSAPIVDGKLMIRMGGDPGRINWTNMSIKMLIQRAYEVKEYQISGPDWLNSTRFDVTAKLPDGAPQSKIPEMLQALLAERFKLTIHRETKDLPMYALVVGKSGPKMKESEIDPNAPPLGGGPGGPGPGGPSAYGGPGPGPAGGAAGGFAGGVRIGKDGKPQFAPGGPMMMMNGRGHLQAKMMNMSSLVDMLARQLDRPVVDQTGLKGNYDFDLDWTPDEGQRPAGLIAGVPPPQGGGEGHVPSASSPEANGVSIFTAVQSQLGLKLDNKKGPVDLIVVDTVEKTPTEN